MNQELTQEIASDRLGLADLHEISDLLIRSGLFCFRVTSWSMYPTLCKGDRLTVEPSSATQLHAGDLILFHHLGRLICHRLVTVQETGAGPRLITRGDTTAGCDAPLQADQVLGRVVAVKRSGLRIGSLALRVDRWLERFTDQVAQGLLLLQRFRCYRRAMRAMFTRRLAYYMGIPEGRRWHRYDRICEGGGAPRLERHQNFHLLAKLRGTAIASLHVVPRGEEYWLEALYVRIRYRGLGLASQLLALAATAAAMSGARMLLASVEPENTPAHDLFTKAGFRQTGGLRGNQVSLRRDL